LILLLLPNCTLLGGFTVHLKLKKPTKSLTKPLASPLVIIAYCFISHNSNCLVEFLWAKDNIHDYNDSDFKHYGIHEKKIGFLKSTQSNY